MKKIKRVLKRAVALACTATLFLGGGCSWFNSSDKEDLKDALNEVVGGSSSSTETVAVLSDEERYKTVSAPMDSGPVIIDSATDGITNYYLLDLGYSKDVPLSSGTTIEYNGQTPMSVAFEKSCVTQETVSSSLETAVTKTINTVSLGSAQFSVDQKFDYKIGETSLGASYSRQWGTEEENTNSTTDTYSTAISTTETLTEKISYTIGEHGEKAGSYRLSLVSTCDMYAFVQTSADNSVVRKVTCSFSARQDSRLKLEYDEDGLFDGKQQNKITLPENYYQTLPLPERFVESSDIYAVPTVNVFNNNDVLTVTDAGTFGLGQDVYDKIDLSAYKEYFTDEYVFCFDVCINVSEKDDGNQEVYLYNQLLFNGSSELDISWCQQYYGLLCDSLIATASGIQSLPLDHYIVWYVRGDQMRDFMYVRYDAHGGGSDTWYRNTINIDLTVTEPLDIPNNHKEVLSNELEYKVDDNSFYGLRAGRDYEEFDLSDYAHYMNSGYLFQFDVSIDLREKHDGHQEIFLYNKFLTTTNDESLFTAISSYGLVAEKMIEHGYAYTATVSANFNFVLNVTGDNVAKKMYVRYDAHGEETDTWYKEKIKIKVSVVKIPNFIKDETVWRAYEQSVT